MRKGRAGPCSVRVEKKQGVDLPNRGGASASAAAPPVGRSCVPFSAPGGPTLPGGALVPRRLPTFLTEPQMVALALAPDPASRKGTRDRAILALLLACGLRASELCQLQPRDISPSLVFVRHGKFGHQRFVPISKRAHAAISHYLAAHPAQAGGPLLRTLD
ncbi:MAG: tyrosine-type recombinase/integrase, partial [Elusimicrobiota bacterium]